MNRTIQFFTIVVGVSFLGGCTEQAAQPSQDAAQLPKEAALPAQEASQPSNPAQGQNVLVGVLLRHPAAHTRSSFFTGDYHLRTADGTLHWLSDTENVSYEDFDRCHEQRVRLSGAFEDGGEWDGSDGTAGPSLAPGETWKWPDHFRVDKLELLQ